MIIMTIRYGSKILMQAVELKQVINKQWPNIKLSFKLSVQNSGAKNILCMSNCTLAKSYIVCTQEMYSFKSF